MKVHPAYCSSAKVRKLHILGHKAGRAPRVGVHGAMPPWIEPKKKGGGVYFVPKYGPNRHFQLKVVSLLVSMCVGGCMQCPDRCIMAPLGAVQVGGRGSFSRTSLVQARLVRPTQRR